MKTLRYLVLFACVLATTGAWAQAIQFQLRQTVVNNGATLKIDLIATRTASSIGPVPLGNCDFSFNYNRASLNMAAASFTPGIWDASNAQGGAAYLAATGNIGQVDNSGSLGYYVVRVRRNMNFTGQQPGGIAIPPINSTNDTVTGRIATIRVPITNCNDTSGIRWRNLTSMPGIGTKYLYGNATPIALNAIQYRGYGFATLLGQFPLRAPIAPFTLTCDNIPLGVAFSGAAQPNAVRYKVQYTYPGNPVVVRNFLPGWNGRDSLKNLTPNTTVTIRVVAYGSCNADSLASVINCTAQGCPVLTQDPPVVSVSGPICPGTSYTVTADNTIPNAAAPLSYSFDGGANFGPNNVLTVTNPTASATYNVQIRDNNGCLSGTQTVNVTVRQLNNPSAAITIAEKSTVNGATYCEGTNVALSVQIPSGEPEINSIEWTTTGRGSFTPNTSANSISYVPAPGEAGNVKVYVRNACFRLVDSLEFSYIPSPVGAIEIDPNSFVRENSVVIGERIRFLVPASNTFPGYTYTWRVEDRVEITTTPEFFYTFLRPGTISVRVDITATSSAGTTCAGSATLDVKAERQQSIFVPNVIAPTSTKPENANLRIYGQGIDGSGFQMVVVDRYGQVVYETSNMSQAMNQGWNGAKNNSGDLLPVGSYTYAIKGKYLDGTSFEKSGNVTIIR